MQGQIVGQYKVMQPLGEGGMGVVYLAEHSLLGRKAAIKVLLPSLSADKGIVNRFFNEARAVTTISDPGIVQVFDFGFHHDGSAYIVMELLEGETLGSRLRKLGRFTIYDALRIVLQMARSLQNAHAKGIVHRDLKPDNVFLCGDPAVTGGERAKILDFGIAKLTANTGGEKTKTSLLMGTPMYMSPEQCRGAGEVDHRSDIYSLGCLLFLLMTGRPPFIYEATGELIAAHLKETPPLPSSLVNDLPTEIDALVMLCLAKRVEDRFQSMKDVCDAIAAIERQLGIDVLTRQTPVSLSEQMARAVVTASGQRTPAPISSPTAPTTLGTSSGQVSGVGIEPPKRSKTGVIVLAFGLVAAAIVVIAIVASKGDKGDTTAATNGSGAPIVVPPPPDPGSAVAKGSAETKTPETKTPETKTPEAGSAAVATGSGSAAEPAGAGSDATVAGNGSGSAATVVGVKPTKPIKPTGPKPPKPPKPTGGSNAASTGSATTTINRGD